MRPKLFRRERGSDATLECRATPMRPNHFRSECGMTLVEMLVACGVLLVIGMGLVMGLAALQRNFQATCDYATNHGDEMRISDYLARDLRRATSVSVSGTGSATTVTMTLPNYYDSTGSPRVPVVNSDGTVAYQDASVTPPVNSTSVTYYLSNGTMYRSQNAVAKALAVNVQSFQLTLVDSATDPNAGSDFNLSSSLLGKVAEVKTQISFSPHFSNSGSTQNGIKSTTFYNTTLLRNARTDTKVTLY
jgi:type II secretory pathway component PulJ